MKTEIIDEKTPEGTCTGSFIVGKDHQLTLEVRLVINVSHKKYPKFLEGLNNHINEYKGDGLIEYMSGI